MKCLKNLLPLIACLWALTGSAAPAQEFKLPNGLKLIVKEDHRASVVMSQVWYKVGSSYESDGITGISHALEHMMFRGSKNYGPNQFIQIIGENGGEQNAFTAYDFTAYHEMLSADKLAIAFKLEADRMRNLSLKAEDFAKEIQVVMEERRLRIEDDPQQLTVERFLAAANVSNPYHHPIIGWMDDLQHMTIDDLRQWYQNWYGPNNAVVVVVGDVKPEVVYQLAQEYFGKLPMIKLPTLKPQKEIKPLGKRTLIVKAPAKTPWLIMGYNTPVLNTAEQRWEPYALYVLTAILDGGESARLESNLVRGKQIVSEVDVGYNPYDRIDNVLILEATPADGHTVKEVREALQAEIKRLQTEPVTPAELARVKAQIIANKVYQKDSIEYQAYEIGSLESVGISWQEADQAIKAIEQITPEQVQAVAKKYLTDERLTVAVLQPLPITGKTPPAPAPGRGGIGAQNVH